MQLFERLRATSFSSVKLKDFGAAVRLASLTSDHTLKGNGLRWRGITDKVTSVQWNPKNQGKVLCVVFV